MKKKKKKKLGKKNMMKTRTPTQIKELKNTNLNTKFSLYPNIEKSNQHLTATTTHHPETDPGFQAWGGRR